MVALGLLIPFLLGLAVTQSLAGGLTALLWGGFVRIFLLHHVTWSINSVCHFFGRRRFDTDDHSTNVFWLAALLRRVVAPRTTMPSRPSAKHCLRRWENDTSALLISALERLGRAWNVVKLPPERKRAKWRFGTGWRRRLADDERSGSRLHHTRGIRTDVWPRSVAAAA